jgi:hypothetical protein
VAAFRAVDIGPVRRRFIAEPASSPVPGEEPSVHEPSALERAANRPTEPAPHDDVATSTGTLRSP